MIVSLYSYIDRYAVAVEYMSCFILGKVRSKHLSTFLYTSRSVYPCYRRPSFFLECALWRCFAPYYQFLFGGALWVRLSGVSSDPCVGPLGGDSTLVRGWGDFTVENKMARVQYLKVERNKILLRGCEPTFL